jgi:hypothetical protein
LGGVVGLYIYIAFVLAFFYMYTEGLGKSHDLAADISIYTAAIIVGVVTWYNLARYNIPLAYEILVGGLGLVGLFVWMMTCSYKKCANVYEIPVE